MNTKLKLGLLGLGAIIIAVIASLSIGSYLERRHQINEQRQQIQKSVAEISEATSQLLRYETTSSSITYGEIFERGEERIKKLSEATIPVAISGLPQGEKDAAKSYLEDLEDLLRLEVAKYRKQLAASSALDAVKDASRDLANSSYYGRDFANTRYQKALEDAEKSITEMNGADNEFYRKVVDVQEKLSLARTKLADYSLLNGKILLEIIEAHKRQQKRK